MVDEPLESDKLIAHLSHRPSYILDSMITVQDAHNIRPSNLARDSRPSSMGQLDKLPVELLLATLDLLDFQSLSRLSRVSLHARSTVHSLPAWRDLMDHAPQALKALGLTQLLSLHSVASLRTALRSELCASCPEFGAYLFLPTCSRCCWECSFHNAALRVVPPTRAGRIFGLSEEHLGELPVMVTIPGIYGRYGRYDDERLTTETLSHEVVSVKAAKELGLAVHGSMENIVRIPARRTMTLANMDFLPFFRSATGDRGGDRLAPSVQDTGPPPNRYFGKTSVPFPSLQVGGSVEDGLWCRGCDQTHQRCKQGLLSEETMTSIAASQGVRPGRGILQALARRARSRAGFLEHTKRCHGVQNMLAGIETEESAI